MILIDLAAFIILLFLGYFVLFQLYIISCSSRGRIVDIEKRNYSPKFQQNVTVIVYSHNNASTIIDLVESLKKQEYDKEKYSINVILDNCEDNSAKLLEILGGTRLWRISTDIKPIGKHKAIAWLLERILSSENTNTFVFLNGDCTVRPDFLLKLNASIYENPVLMGEVLPLNLYPNLMTSYACLKNKIKFRVMNHGRYYASLCNILDADISAIRQDIFEKINFPIIDNGFEEYEYSIKLSQAKIQTANTEQLSAYKQFAENFESVSQSVYRRRYKSFITLKNNFKMLFSRQNFHTKELLLSLIYPSSVTFIILNLLLLAISMNTRGLFSSIAGYKAPLIILTGYICSKFFALLAARCNFNDLKNGIYSIFISPMVFLSSFFYGFKIKLPFKISFPSINQDYKNCNKQIVTATLTDGKKELACKLEIRQDSNSNQVIFIFNDKKLVSSKHARIDEALEELIEKLKLHGFALKVCMNCGYFKTNDLLAAKFGGEQGYCLFDNIDRESNAQEYSYIWNSCSNIIPAQARNYIQNQLDSNKPE